MKKYLLAAAALLTVGAPASAAISGGRVEAVVGWDSVGLNLEDFDLGNADESGIVYGLGVGYDFAVGEKLSVGVDAEISDGTTDVEITDAGDSIEMSIGRDLYVGGRVTAAVSDTFNLYGKVGYTNARLNVDSVLGGVTDSFSGELEGVRAGIGGQFAIGTRAYIGAEYRYSNYEADFSRNQVVGTVGFRF